MQPKQFFIFVVLVAFPFLLSAQLRVQPALSIPLAPMIQQINVPMVLLPGLSTSHGNSTAVPTALLDNNRFSTTTQAPPSLAELKYTPHLAFFCRVEVKIDKAIGTPFRFRLGSVDYVDYLEGKRKDY